MAICSVETLIGFQKTDYLSWMKMCFLLSLVLLSDSLPAQTADELNRQSKEALGKQDYKKAIPLIKLAAEKGNPEAEYNYGVSFQEGVEVEKNDSLANVWFLKSAQQGWKDSQFKIAYSYGTGRGIEKNDKMAFYWSMQCAQQADEDCIFNVITCYMNGTGTRKSTDSMLIWAIRLASMPNPEDLTLSGKITSARANLARMYRDGDIIPKNYEQSYMWFLIYNEGKRDFSILDQQQIIGEIQDLEKLLNPAERTQAKTDAENRIGRKLINLGSLNKQDL